MHHPILEPSLVGIGMFTGGTDWILTPNCPISSSFFFVFVRQTRNTSFSRVNTTFFVKDEPGFAPATRRLDQVLG